MKDMRFIYQMTAIPIISILVLIVTVIANRETALSRYKAGYVASKYKVERPDNYGEKRLVYVISLYDKEPQGAFDQNFKMTEWYVEKHIWDQVDVGEIIKLKHSQVRYLKKD